MNLNYALKIKMIWFMATYIINVSRYQCLLATVQHGHGIIYIAGRHSYNSSAYG